MDQNGLNLYGIYRQPKPRCSALVHKDQLEVYGHKDPDQSTHQFRSRYRFREQTVKELARLFESEIGPKVPTNRALSTEQRINCALKFFANGSFQTIVGDSEAVSQPTMHRVIEKVTDCFAAQADKLIRFSLDKDILEKNSNKFFGFKGRVPNVVGIIDGTQIPIVAPYSYPEQYVNRDGKMSIGVQVMVNYRGFFTHMSCRWPGSLHDSRILQESDLQEVLDSYALGQYYILGDSGYACQTNLLTPYTYLANQDEQEIHYNRCFSQTRCKVECVIGMWKRKFPCLKKGLEYQPAKVTKIIKSVGFLWNFGLLVGDNEGYDPKDYVIPDKVQFDEEVCSTVGGRLVREQLKKYLWAHR